MLQKLETGKAIVGEERKELAEQLKKAYKKGTRPGELAEAIGRSRSFVDTLLREAQTKRRQPQPLPLVERGKRGAQLRKEYDAGASVQSLSARHNLGRRSTNTLLSHVNTRMRQRRGRHALQGEERAKLAAQLKSRREKEQSVIGLCKEFNLSKSFLYKLLAEAR